MPAWSVIGGNYRRLPTEGSLAALSSALIVPLIERWAHGPWAAAGVWLSVSGAVCGLSLTHAPELLSLRSDSVLWMRACNICTCQVTNPDTFPVWLEMHLARLGLRTCLMLMGDFRKKNPDNRVTRVGKEYVQKALRWQAMGYSEEPDISHETLG